MTAHLSCCVEAFNGNSCGNAASSSLRVVWSQMNQDLTYRVGFWKQKKEKRYLPFQISFGLLSAIPASLAGEEGRNCPGCQKNGVLYVLYLPPRTVKFGACQATRGEGRGGTAAPAPKELHSCSATGLGSPLFLCSLGREKEQEKGKQAPPENNLGLSCFQLLGAIPGSESGCLNCVSRTEKDVHLGQSWVRTVLPLYPGTQHGPPDSVF